MRLTVVVSSNGAGHLRRSVGVLDRLTARHPALRTTIVCTARQLDALRGWSRLQRLWAAGAEFLTGIECGVRWPLDPATGDLLAWRDRLAEVPAVDAADLVVSDNLAGVLTLRTDTVLMGSFLWSEVLAGTSAPAVDRFADRFADRFVDRFVADEFDLLRRYRPPMLCVAAIATPAVLRHTDAVPLPWMCEAPAPRPRTLPARPRIGVCGGTTTAAGEQVARIVRALAARYDVVVDGGRESARLAGVSTGLMRELPVTAVDLVLCRPGAGTVMECVATNTPFVTFHEPGSPEMAHVAGRLADLGVAPTLSASFTDADIVEAVGALLDPVAYRATSDRLHALPKDGLDRAAQWLYQRLEAC